MTLTNTQDRYGLIAILFHWLLAVSLIGLFALGTWMVDLNLYHAWYHDAPQLHKSIGVLVVLAMLLRWVWRLYNPTPKAIGNDPKILKKAAHIAHLTFYGLVAGLGISGYFISTAEGDGIEVFNLFVIPAYSLGIENQADFAGEVHFYLAYAFMALFLVHTLAALKHHFMNKDHTLKRMLGKAN